MAFGDAFKQADWKTEKHVPAIDCPATVGAGEAFDVKVCVGKEIAHPNTTEHHIRWIGLYFKPAEGAAYELATLVFTAHGESAKGANEGPAYTDPFGSARVKLGESGTLTATSYCNIHGLWESSTEISVG
jgi:superoxide reductase